jgi:hypothetical protein
MPSLQELALVIIVFFLLLIFLKKTHTEGNDKTVMGEYGT